jgi:hypothetical protein
MNSIADKLVEQVRLSTDYQINKTILKEKALTELHLPYGGGLFFVDTNLISFLNCWDEVEIYVKDVYDNPIKVDRKELLSLAKERYQAVMNQWHQEHAELRQIRKI